MKTKRTTSAFTLIEIIIVLIILGILAAIALPNLFSNVKKSRSAEALTSLGSYKTIVEACVQSHPSSAGANCAGLTFSSTQNFTYDFSAAPSDGDTNYTIQATGQGELTNADYIALERTSDAETGEVSFNCTTSAAFSGVC